MKPSNLRFIQHQIERSNLIIQRMLTLSKRPYVALSFGKDSLVMIDLIRQFKPNIPCLFLKSEESDIIYNYEEVVSQYQAKGYNIRVVKTYRLSDNNYNWEAARKAGRNDFYIGDFAANWDGVFMGLRIGESKQRRVSLVRKDNNVIYDKIMRYKLGKRKGMLRCCPMAYWSAFEIMFYLRQRGLPYLEVYDLGEEVRTTARLTGDAVRNNALIQIKQANPERFNRIIRILPELKKFC